MKILVNWVWSVAAVAMITCALALAADDKADDKKGEKKSDEIKLELKDFKFKIPRTSSEELFVFNESEERLCFYTNGAAEAKFKLPADGEFDIIVSASGDPAMNIRPKFQVVMDDKLDEKGLGKETTLTSEDVKDYKFTVALKKGEHKISVAFINDTYNATLGYDSNLYLHGVKIGPHKPDPAKKAEKK